MGCPKAKDTGTKLSTTSFLTSGGKNRKMGRLLEYGPPFVHGLLLATGSASALGCGSHGRSPVATRVVRPVAGPPDRLSRAALYRAPKTACMPHPCAADQVAHPLGRPEKGAAMPARAGRGRSGLGALPFLREPPPQSAPCRLPARRGPLRGPSVLQETLRNGRRAVSTPGDGG